MGCQNLQTLHEGNSYSSIKTIQYFVRQQYKSYSTSYETYFESNVIEAAQIDLSTVQVKAPISTQKTTILYRSLVAVFHISLQ